MEEIKLNLENLSNEEREQLMKLIEKANKPKTGRWKPNHGDMYWYITAFVAFGVSCRKYEGNKDDENNLLLGNVFKTTEEAKFALEKRKIEVELQDIADKLNDGWVPDWNNKDELKYFLYYDHEKEKIGYTYNVSWDYGNVVRFKGTNLIKAIELIGEERLKKYYFEVE